MKLFFNKKIMTSIFIILVVLFNIISYIGSLNSSFEITNSNSNNLTSKYSYSNSNSYRSTNSNALTNSNSSKAKLLTLSHTTNSSSTKVKTKTKTKAKAKNIIVNTFSSQLNNKKERKINIINIRKQDFQYNKNDKNRENKSNSSNNDTADTNSNANYIKENKDSDTPCNKYISSLLNSSSNNIEKVILFNDWVKFLQFKTHEYSAYNTNQNTFFSNKLYYYQNNNFNNKKNELSEYLIPDKYHYMIILVKEKLIITSYNKDLMLRRYNKNKNKSSINNNLSESNIDIEAYIKSLFSSDSNSSIDKKSKEDYIKYNKCWIINITNIKPINPYIKSNNANAGTTTNDFDSGVIDLESNNEGFCFNINEKENDYLSNSSSTELTWLFCFDNNNKKIELLSKLISLYKINKQVLNLAVNKNNHNDDRFVSLNDNKVNDNEFNYDSNSKNGYWVVVKNWSECSKPCGGGVSHLNRLCIPPLGNGLPCFGDSVLIRECNTHECKYSNSSINITNSSSDNAIKGVVDDTTNNKNTLSIEFLNTTTKKPSIQFTGFSNSPLKDEYCVIKEEDLLLTIDINCHNNNDNSFNSKVIVESIKKDTITSHLVSFSNLNSQQLNEKLSDSVKNSNEKSSSTNDNKEIGYLSNKFPVRIRITPYSLSIYTSPDQIENENDNRNNEAPKNPPFKVFDLDDIKVTKYLEKESYESSGKQNTSSYNLLCMKIIDKTTDKINNNNTNTNANNTNSSSQSIHNKSITQNEEYINYMKLINTIKSKEVVSNLNSNSANDEAESNSIILCPYPLQSSVSQNVIPEIIKAYTDFKTTCSKTKTKSKINKIKDREKDFNNDLLLSNTINYQNYNKKLKSLIQETQLKLINSQERAQLKNQDRELTNQLSDTNSLAIQALKKELKIERLIKNEEKLKLRQKENEINKKIINQEKKERLINEAITEKTIINKIDLIKKFRKAEEKRVKDSIIKKVLERRENLRRSILMLREKSEKKELIINDILEKNRKIKMGMMLENGVIAKNNGECIDNFDNGGEYGSDSSKKGSSSYKNLNSYDSENKTSNVKDNARTDVDSGIKNNKGTGSSNISNISNPSNSLIYSYNINDDQSDAKDIKKCKIDKDEELQAKKYCLKAFKYNPTWYKDCIDMEFFCEICCKQETEINDTKNRLYCANELCGIGKTDDDINLNNQESILKDGLLGNNNSVNKFLWKKTSN